MWQIFEVITGSGNKIALFSEMPENRARKAEIRAITGPGINVMTDFFAGEAQQGTTAAIRHQAEYDAEEKAWHLVELKRFDGGAFKNMFTPATVGKTQNIFDALHWCSEFQAFSEQNSDLRIANPGKEYSRGFKHWRDVAKDMKLPLAENGVLVLPEKGRILPDGHYSGAQIIAAYESDPRAMPAVIPPAPVSIVDAASRYQHAIAKAGELDKMNVNDYMEGKDFFASAMATLFLGSFPSIIAFKVTQAFLPVVAAMLLPWGLVEMTAYIAGNRDLFPDRGLRKRCTAFNKAAALLPDPEDRALCEEFARQAQFKFWAGRAQIIYEKKTKAGKSAEAGLPCLEKAAKAIGLDDRASEKLKTVYMAAGLDADGDKRLKDVGQKPVSWSDVESRLKNAALKLAA